MLSPDLLNASSQSADLPTWGRRIGGAPIRGKGGGMGHLRVTEGLGPSAGLRGILHGRGFLVTALLACSCLAGCGAARSQSQPLALADGGYAIPADDAPAFDPTSALELPDQSYRLAAGDLIDVRFPYHPEENERVPVRPDGKINLQITGDMTAAGLTVSETESQIRERASRYLKDPVVSVVVAQLAEHKVYVGGDVIRPGFVLYRDGLTPLQAVIERGGFTDTADSDNVLYVSRIGGDVRSERLDLAAVAGGDEEESIFLVPDDIIMVPKTWIGQADVFVDQWVRGLLPTVPRPGVDLNALLF